jgi:hypothetical protein
MLGLGGRKEITSVFRRSCVLKWLCFLALKRTVKALRWVWEMKGNGRELWDQAERWGCLRPTDVGRWQACSRQLVFLDRATELKFSSTR